MSNRLVIDPDGATLTVMVSDISGDTAPSLTDGGAQMSVPTTISSPTTIYLAHSGEVLVSMRSASGAEVASEDGVPLRVMVSGSVTIHAHVDNEQQAGRSAAVGGWPGQMAPFPGHWMLPKYANIKATDDLVCYQSLTFCPVDVVVPGDKIGWYSTISADNGSVTVVVAGCDENGWPGPIVATAEASSAQDFIEVDLALPQGRYWVAVVSFDDDTYAILACQSSATQSPVTADVWLDGGTDLSTAIDTATGAAGLVMIHATTVGGDVYETVTEVPEVVVPGIAAPIAGNGAPAICVRAAA